MAKKLTAVDKKKAAAMTAQGAKLIAAQKAGTYTAPKVTPAKVATPPPTPAAPKAAAAPAPALPKASAPVSQVSSYTPPVNSAPLGNQKAGKTGGSSGGKSSSPTPVTRGANAAQSLAGLQAVTGAVNNALTSKGKAPVSSPTPTGIGRYGNGDQAEKYARDFANLSSDVIDKYGKVQEKVANSSAGRRIQDIYRDAALPGTGTGLSAALDIGSAALNKFAGTNVDLNAGRNKAEDYFNKEIATNYGPATRVAQGTGDKWDKAALGLGMLPFGAGVVPPIRGMTSAQIAKYGLSKPLSKEGWHIQPIETAKMGIKANFALAPADIGELVQKKFRLSTATMKYISQYEFAVELCEGLLAGRKAFSAETMSFLQEYEFWGDLKEKLGL